MASTVAFPYLFDSSLNLYENFYSQSDTDSDLTFEDVNVIPDDELNSIFTF